MCVCVCVWGGGGGGGEGGGGHSSDHERPIAAINQVYWTLIYLR